MRDGLIWESRASRFGSHSAANGESVGVAIGLEVPVSELTFFQAQSLVDSSFLPGSDFSVRQSLGYGVDLYRSSFLRFSITPGFAGGYEDASWLPAEERFGMMGNLSQALSWRPGDAFQINQRFNYSIQRIDEDNLAAFMNLDLETLLTESLSFRVSYEVKYDDRGSEEMELREARVSGAIGFDF